jgi:hypothetical protein
LEKARKYGGRTGVKVKKGGLVTANLAVTSPVPRSALFLK